MISGLCCVLVRPGIAEDPFGGGLLCLVGRLDEAEGFVLVAPHEKVKLNVGGQVVKPCMCWLVTNVY